MPPEAVGRPDLGGVAELVAVMDRLRSPGGCPWDAEQTHESLLTYLVEEAHEFVDAVETGSREDMREELGDVLLQVVFHARLAQEDPSAAFDLDDVARTTAAKLVARHPHVFGSASVRDADHVRANWEQIKAAEKSRDSVLDGVPAGLGALARAAKVAGRAQRSGLDVAVPDVAGSESDDDVGSALLRLVVAAVASGVDPEAELRRVARDWEAGLRAQEAARGDVASPRKAARDGQRS